MVGARTAAMGFNRIVDRHIDARNPRTARRELPTGQVSLAAAAALTLASIALFVAAAAWLGPLCLALSPVALALVLGYSYTKRFTWLCHLFLGLAIAAGPGGAWIAVTGDVSAPALWLMAAVATWIGGFDILYALADRDFDRQEGLQSIPARFGISGRAGDLRRAARPHRGRAAGPGPLGRPGRGLPGRRRPDRRHSGLGARHRPPQRISPG